MSNHDRKWPVQERVRMTCSPANLAPHYKKGMEFDIVMRGCGPNDVGQWVLAKERRYSSPRSEIGDVIPADWTELV